MNTIQQSPQNTPSESETIPDILTAEDVGLALPPPSKPLALSIALLMLAVFIADVLTPDSYHAGVIYNLCIALTLWSWRPRWVISVTVVSLLLRFIGHAVSPPTPPMFGSVDRFNLIFGVIVQALTGALIWRQVVVQRQMEGSQERARKLLWERRRSEANLLAAERKAREEAQSARENALGQAQALRRALEEADMAIRQAQHARQEAERAKEQEKQTLRDLRRVKNLSVALQRAVLPSHEALEGVRGIDIGAVYTPAERHLEIGGDFYDVIALDETNTRFGLVIGDVAGHGVEAAAQTALVTTTLRAYAMEDGDHPAAVMTRVAGAINNQLDSFVSLFFGIYDTRTRALIYANAGHEPPILVRGGVGEAPVPLMPTGTILGVGETEFHQDRVTLAEGDTLVLLTDGVTEARAITGQMLGWDGAAALARRRCSGPMRALNAQGIADGLLLDARAFAADQILTDDVALLVVRVTE